MQIPATVTRRNIGSNDRYTRVQSIAKRMKRLVKLDTATK